MTDTGHIQSLPGRVSRGKALVFLAILMICWHLFSAYIAQEPRYGFHQMKAIPPWEAVALFTAAILAALLVRLRGTASTEPALPLPYSRLFPRAVLAAALSAVVFWLLRNGFINDDGLFNMVSLQAGMRILHHDEMLSSLMVTKIWQSGTAGLRPEDSISLFSAVWGGVYVLIIVLLGGRTVGRRWPLFLLGCLSAGYVQLFAGDVEFYGMVASLIALYLLLCLEHIRGNITLVLPSMALALAMCSHLLAGWLLPSLLFLFLRALKKGKKAESAVSAVAFLLTIAFIFIIVSAQGLPVHTITQSHAMGTADRSTLDMLAVPSLHYHAGVLNVLFLVFPFWLAFPLIMGKGWLKERPFNLVLAVCTGMLILLALVWNLGLGPYHDWNLIAAVGVPASVLLWSNALRGRLGSSMKASLILLMLVAAIHSWTWIAANHFSFSIMNRDILEGIHFPTGKPVQIVPMYSQTDTGPQ